MILVHIRLKDGEVAGIRSRGHARGKLSSYVCGAASLLASMMRKGGASVYMRPGYARIDVPQEEKSRAFAEVVSHGYRRLIELAPPGQVVVKWVKQQSH